MIERFLAFSGRARKVWHLFSHAKENLQAQCLLNLLSSSFWDLPFYSPFWWVAHLLVRLKTYKCNQYFTYFA